MKVHTDLRTVNINAGDHRAEALVRVRTIDARVNGRGFIAEQHDPVAVVLRGEDVVKRVSMPQPRALGAIAAAGPAAYLLTRALLKKRRTQ